MQKALKVQLLKNTSDAILCAVFTILECNSVHDFEKYVIPDRIFFSGGLVFCSYAYCNRKKVMVSSAIQVICPVLAGVRFCKPGRVFTPVGPGTGVVYG